MPTTYPTRDPWLWTSYPAPPNRPAIPIAVYRYNASASGSARFQLLPTLRCISCIRGIGTEPGRATLRYEFDGTTAGAPQSIEQALSTAVKLPLAVNPDDQLVVLAQRPDGGTEYLHHGRALGFGCSVAGDREFAEVKTIGIARDLWDSPIAGQLMRNGDDPTQAVDVATDVIVQFNPKGRPNATDQPNWAQGTAPGNEQGDFDYPTFLDPSIIRTPDIRKPWTLASAVRYLIYRHVTADTKIQVPDGVGLDSLLVALKPKGDNFDPADPTTYDIEPIDASDHPWTGRDWPSAVNEMIRDKGFGMSFDLGTGSDGGPQTTLRLFRLQDGTPRDVYLQPRGSWFDAALTNVGAADLTRDISEVINQWTVQGAIDRYEASFVLTPGFPMSANDAADANAMAKFTKTSAGFSSKSDAYRLFVLDETGEGHYANGSNTKLTTIPSLDNLFGAPGQDGKPRYVRRRRRPIGDLFSTDSNNKPLRYQLAISTDSTQDPGEWDGTGTWRIIEGSFALLKDRLGIIITADNPNAWKIGKAVDTNAPFADGIVKVIECLSKPSTVNKPFRLRLTCVVEADSCLTATSPVRAGSILSRPITRTLDARDRFARQQIAESSPFFNQSEANEAGFVVVRDDSDAALAEAVAARMACESGVLDGPIVIPRFTLDYKIGDRIRQIAGRNLPLRTDGGSTSTGAVYPIITKIEHSLDGRQETRLTISDRDGHAHRVETRGRHHR